MSTMLDKKLPRLSMMTSGSILSIVSICIIASLSTWSVSAEDRFGRDERHYARAAYDSGDLIGARKLYLQHAQKGFENSQYDLATMMLQGLGGDVDVDGAIYWFTKAANSAADGRPPSICVKVFRCDVASMDQLGVLYAKGVKVDRDDKKAFHWFSRADELDFKDAQVSLGIMYRDGRGVQQDDQKALEMFVKGASDGNAFAAAEAGRLMLKMASNDSDEAKAAEWMSKAVEGGDLVAMVLLAEMYQSGRGVEQDMSEAKRLLTMAVDEGADGAAARLEKLTTQ